MKTLLIMLIAVLGALLSAPVAEAIEDNLTMAAQVTDASFPTLEALTAKKMALEAAKGPGTADKDNLLKAYTQSIEFLRTAQAWAQKTAGYEAEVALARSWRAQGDLAAASQIICVTSNLTEYWSRAELDQAMASAETELRAIQSRNKELEEQIRRQAKRKEQLPEILANTQAQLQQLIKIPSVASGLVNQVQGEDIRKVVLPCQQKALEQELQAYLKEWDTFDDRFVYLKGQAAQALQQSASWEQTVGYYRDLIQQRLWTQAAQDGSKAQQEIREASEIHPILAKMAQANAELVNQRSGPEGIAGKLEQVAVELKQIEARKTAEQNKFDKIIKRLEAAGITPNTGLLLREYLENAPNVNIDCNRINLRQQEITKVREAMLDLEQELDTTPAGDQEDVAALLKALSQSSQAKPEGIIREASALLESRLAYQKALFDDYNIYFENLVDLNALQTSLVNQAKLHFKFVEGRVLWIPDAQPMGLDDLREARKALMWLCSPGNMVQFFQALGQAVVQAPLVFALVLLALLLLLRMRGFFYQRMRSLSTDSPPATWLETLTYAFGPIAYLLLIAVTWPFFIFMLGWRISLSPQTAEYAHDTAVSLMSTGIVCFIFELVKVIYGVGGLGETRLRWDNAKLAPIQRHMPWFFPIMLVLQFLMVTVYVQEIDVYKTSFVRILYILGMGMITFFFAQVLRPAARLAGTSNRGSLRLWYYLATGFPIVLMGLAWVGYFFTSMVIWDQVANTFWLFLAAVLINAMIGEWLKASTGALAAGGGEGGSPAEQCMRRLSPYVRQAGVLLRSFLFVGLGFLLWEMWVDVLPAMQQLDRARIYPFPVKILEAAAQEIPVPLQQAFAIDQIVTLKDAVLALFVVFLTLVAVRNIPGILELSLWQRLPIEDAQRYTITAITRYLIIVAGIFGTCSILGVTWPSVQWLLAAVSVGLGFGLQEIFANFVSGLIILFERPIRIGDFVSIGNITGKVSQIHIRATRIIDDDRKELVVPNKQFITDQLINWSLSDPVARMMVKVEIVYGAEVELVRSILTEVALAQLYVLKTPAPSVVLDKLGDNGLEFVLFVFVPGWEFFTRTRDALNTGIEVKLREHGIEIATSPDCPLRV